MVLCEINLAVSHFQVKTGMKFLTMLSKPTPFQFQLFSYSLAQLIFEMDIILGQKIIVDWDQVR